MATLTIVADENIIKVQEYFSSIGRVYCVDGRTLSNEQVLGADILLVRSITPVNRQLLEGSRVRFVASATIGVDHLDTQYMDKMGIKWASAPGCNAESVVDYVISALCRLDNVLSRLLSGAKVGIIGMGNVGSSLYRRLDRLGIGCKGYDPLIAQDRYPILTQLSHVLDSDVVCCHTPLTTEGRHATKYMINDSCLEQLREGAVLINAGRGGTVDQQALKRCLSTRSDLRVVLDVWENEPVIDSDLLAQLAYGSAHIAGYSLDGKLAGTRMIYRACCQFLGRNDCIPVTEQEGGGKTIKLSQSHCVLTGIQEAVLSSYDIACDDRRLRKICIKSPDKHAQALAFDQLRKHYPVRREFSHFCIDNTKALDAPFVDCLSALGFGINKE